MYEIFEKLLGIHGVRASEVAKVTGIPPSTFSDWKKGKSKPKQEKLQKIADYFSVTIEYLMTGEESGQLTTPPLTAKDERDIEKILEATKNQLLTQEGLMFDGEPASQESIDSILAAMKIGMEMAKQKNKEKYTPKKYRKD